MNLIFRLVRRKSDGRLVVASELAKSAVKGLGGVMALLCSLMVQATTVTEAEADPGVTGGVDVISGAGAAHVATVTNTLGDDGRVDSTTAEAVSTAATTFATPIVNIATPLNGISHNKYDQFDVTGAGVILNNVVSADPRGFFSSGTTLLQPSDTSANVQQLGSVANPSGNSFDQTIVSIAANPNLSAGTAASVIINEVTVGTGASLLNGWIEVAGKKADVIIANPDGITCGGCSFINAGQTILATGIVGVSSDQVSFELSDNVLTVGDGSATSTQLDAGDLALISRRISVKGKVQSSGQVRALAHNGTVTYDVSADTLTASSTGAEVTTKPEYAIDSTALGGIYANRISLIANESGTGVAVRSDLGAVGDSISISADGALLVAGNSLATAFTGEDEVRDSRVVAQKITLTSEAGSIKIDDANLQAAATAAVAGNLTLTAKAASAGAVVFEEGSVAVTQVDDSTRGTWTIEAVSLTDKIGTDNGRLVQGLFDLDLSGNADLDNASYGTHDYDIDVAGFALGVDASLAAKADATLGASGTLDLDGTLTQSSGTASLMSVGSLSIASTAVVEAANLVLDATTSDLTVTNAQTFAVAGNATFKGDGVELDSDLSIGGDLVAGDSDTVSLNLGDATNTNARTISVVGTSSFTADTTKLWANVAATGAVRFDAQDGGLTSYTGSSVDGRSSITLTHGGNLALGGSMLSQGTLSLTAADLTLASVGSVRTQASGNIALQLGTLTNQGVISAAGMLSLTSGTGTFNNQGQLKAVSSVTVSTTGRLWNEAVLDEVSTAEGRNLGREWSGSPPALAGADTVEDLRKINPDQIGLIESTGSTVTITASETVNEGTLKAATALDLTGTVYRQQLENIFDGTSHAGDTRVALMGPVKQYDYASENGTTSYFTDQHLSIGRANFIPTTTASTVAFGTGTNLNLGGAINATRSGPLTEVDLSPQRMTGGTVAEPTPSNPAGTVGATDATVVANGTTATQVERASNNATTVVNIADPNSQGLSNNAYSRFDISPAGVILNNQAFVQGVTATTELSAVISGNQNLNRSASIILNQVFSTSASKLNGFLEVAGASADVILANPYGIVCDSCGVLNADRLDLIVGTPALSGGLVSGFDTTSAAGSYNLVGAGMDSRTAAQTSIVAPSAELNGSLNAANLYLGLGGGTFTRGDDTTVRATTGTTSETSRALLVTSLGGIFADQITIDNQSSNANALMSILGEFAANAGDQVITSDGAIMVNGRVSATRDLSLVTTRDNNGSSIAGGDIQMLNGAMTAGRNLLLDADSGSLVFNGGQLYSFGDLTFDALTLIDRGTDNEAEFNNTRYAGGTMAFDIDQRIEMAGITYAADTMRFSGASLDFTVGEGAILKTDTLFDADLRSLTNEGTVASLSRVEIDASSFVSNAATVSATARTELTTPTLTNTGSWVGSSADSDSGATVIRVTTATNSGTLASTEAIDWADFSGGASGSISNRGTLSSEQGFALKASSLDNRGTVTLSAQDSATASVWAVNSLNNRVGATLFAGGDWAVNTNATRGVSLTQSGILQGYQNLSLSFGELTLASGLEIAGALEGEAGQALTLNISQSQTLDALLYSGRDLIAAFDAGLTLTRSAAISAIGDNTLTAVGADSDVVNYGFVYAGGNLSVTADDRIGNFATVTRSAGRFLGASQKSGKVYVEQKQTEVARAEMRAGNNVSLVAGDLFVNSSEVRAGADLSVVAGTVSNQVQRADGFETNDPIAHTTDEVLNYRRTEVSDRYYDFPDDKEDIDITHTWDEFEYYKDGVAAVTPMLKAGGVYSLTGTTAVNNFGGLITADGTGASSITGTLTNDALSLTREDWTWTQERNIHYIAKGGLKYSDNISGAYPTAGVPISILVKDANDDDVVGNAFIEAPNGTLTVSGGSLENYGSFATANSNKSTTAGSTLNPGGFSLNLTLPNNPNGFFVTNRDPSAKYLVEMNPRLQPGVSTLGSDYLLENLNVDSDSITQRLGDAGYEAYLVEQQLIQMTGSSVLNGFNNIADVMSGFMDSAVAQADTLGLTFGQPLTDEQLAGLDEPIVWMVETEVNGQTVLAPQVYLPKRITDEIAGRSAVISANELEFDVDTFDNLGGQIAAAEDLSINAQGDVTNLSGQISGGDVTITSQEGDIRNETFNEFAGNDLRGSTAIGNTASISSRNDLTLDAAGDITNLGAELSADGDANLDADGEITFDTIENRTNTFAVRAGGQSGTRTASQRVEQIGSGLTVGGDLNATTGEGDITFANTEVNVAGNANLDSAGDINLIDREDSFETQSREVRSGVGVGGGGLIGTQKTEITTTQIRSRGTEFNVGGDASLSADGDLLLKGSDLNVDGNADIDAENLIAIDGRNIDARTERVETMTIGGANKDVAPAADGSTADGVTLAQITIEEREDFSQRSVGSGINVGGDLSADVENDVILRGSEVNAGGDVDIEAENIRLLAAQNIERSFESTTTINIGVYAASESEGEAGVDVGTEAGASTDVNGNSLGGTAQAKAGAGASAGASASGSASATVDLLRAQTDTELNLDITNTGSAINAGGNLRLDADETIELEGSEIVAEGDVDVNATDILAREARDVSITETTSETTRLGIYADAGGEAEASAGAESKAQATGGAGINSMQNGASASATAGASAEAGGKAGVGIQAKNARATETQTDTTAVVSAIRSTGGSVTRTAENSIVDIGTEIEAAENFTQSAETITSLAARNTSDTTATYDEVTARTGIYVEAEGEAEAKAGASGKANAQGAKGEVGASASAEGGARAGIEVMVDTLSERARESSTEAVVSTITVGGNVSSTSTGDSTFEGTRIDAGGDLDVAGDNVNILAARDTSESEFDSLSTSSRVAVAVGVGGSAEAGAKADTKGKAEAGAEAEGGVKVRAEIELNVATESESERATEAVAASFNARNINLNAGNDVNIEGADLAADDSINVDARELNVTAAENTFESESSSTEVNVEVMVEATIIGSTGVAGEAEVGVDVESEQASGSEAVVGSLSSSNLNIRTQEDANFEGTQVEATESANLDVGGDLNITAAQTTEQSSANATSVSVAVEGDSGGEFGAEVGVGVSSEEAQSSQATVANFNVGDLSLRSGGDTNIEGANIDATGDADLDIGGDLNVTAARNTASSSSQSVEVEVEVGVAGEDGDDGSSTSEGEFGVGVNVEVTRANSSEAVTGGIRSGGRLNIETEGDATFEGADLSGEGGVDLVAGGDVAFNEAVSTSDSLEVGVGVGIGMESETETASDGSSESKGKQSLDLELALGIENSAQGQASSVSGGEGGIRIRSGGDLSLTETEFDQDAELDIDGLIVQNELTDESFEFGVEASASFKNQTKSSTAAKDSGDGNEASDSRSEDSSEGESDERGAATDTRDTDNEQRESSDEPDRPRQADDAEGERRDNEDTRSREVSDEAGESSDDKPESSSSAAESEPERVSDGSEESAKESDEPKADEAEEESEAPEIAFLDKANPNEAGRGDDEPEADEPEAEAAPESVVMTDGRALIPGLEGLSRSDVNLTDASGEAAPAWIDIDAQTGEVVAVPPVGFEGSLNLTVELPGGELFEIEVGE